MIILDFAKVLDYDLNYDFVCLSSSPHLGFFVQGTSRMFENEMIIIEMWVEWVKQLVIWTWIQLIDCEMLNLYTYIVIELVK